MYRRWRLAVIKLLSFLKCARFSWSLITLRVHWGLSVTECDDSMEHRWDAPIFWHSVTQVVKQLLKKIKKKSCQKEMYSLKPASKVKLCSFPYLAFRHSNVSLLHYLCSDIFPKISFKLHLHTNIKYTCSFLYAFFFLNQKTNEANGRLIQYRNCALPQ